MSIPKQNMFPDINLNSVACSLVLVCFFLVTDGLAGKYTGQWNSVFDIYGSPDYKYYHISFTVDDNDVITSLFLNFETSCYNFDSITYSLTPNVQITNDSFTVTNGKAADEDYCVDGEGVVFSGTFSDDTSFSGIFTKEECGTFCSSKTTGMWSGSFALPATSLTQCITPPYSQDFSAPTSLPGWKFNSDNNGNIGVRSGMLIMDDFVADQTSSLNEAVLCVNLKGTNNVVLSFDHMEFSDQDTPLQSEFLNRVNGDGISISNDGTTWHSIVDATTLAASHTNYVVSLDEEVQRIQSTHPDFGYTRNFYFKFQQYDNFPSYFPSFESNADGRGWDDISITADGGSKGDFWTLFLPAILSSTNTPPSTPQENDTTFSFPGNWQGTFTGTDSGTWNVQITGSGNITGTGFSNDLQNSFTLQGTVIDNNFHAEAFAAGGASTGAEFDGKVVTPGSVSGAWVNNNYTSERGTFSGSLQ